MRFGWRNGKKLYQPLRILKYSSATVDSAANAQIRISQEQKVALVVGVTCNNLYKTNKSNIQKWMKSYRRHTYSSASNSLSRIYCRKTYFRSVRMMICGTAEWEKNKRVRMQIHISKQVSKHWSKCFSSIISILRRYCVFMFSVVVSMLDRYNYHFVYK